MDICQIDSMHDEFNNLINLLDSNEKIDILVNSAGVHGNQKFGTITEEDWNSVIDTNLKGLYFMCQVVSNYMKKNKINGNILNISSASALKPAWSPYEISKWGVKGLTLGLARELILHGIVVNALAPGPTATDMINYKEGNSLNWSTNPSGRIATTEEIGDLAVYMVSGLGRYVIGDTFYITGGSGTICIDK